MSLVVADLTEIAAEPHAPASIHAQSGLPAMAGPVLSGLSGRPLFLDAVTQRVRPILLPLDEPWVELRDS